MAICQLSLVHNYELKMLSIRLSSFPKNTNSPLYLLLLNVGLKVLASAIDKKEKQYGKRNKFIIIFQMMKLSI